MTGKKRCGRLCGAALQAGLVVLILFAVHLFQVRDTVTGPAPDVAGVGIDGEPLSLAALRGRPVLLHFWATWCPVCRAEQSAIDGIAEDHAVLTVALEETAAEDLRVYLHERELDYPVLRDPQGEFSGRYGVTGVPASFILDADGIIRFTEIGFTTGIGLRFRLWLAEHWPFASAE